MAYQIKETFYELRKVGYRLDGNTEIDIYIVKEVFPCEVGKYGDSRTVMRGTLSHCKAWLDERPGTAVSIAE